MQANKVIVLSNLCILFICVRVVVHPITSRVVWVKVEYSAEPAFTSSCNVKLRQDCFVSDSPIIPQTQLRHKFRQFMIVLLISVSVSILCTEVKLGKTRPQSWRNLPKDLRGIWSSLKKI